MKILFTLTLFITSLAISAIAQPSFTALPVPVDKQKATTALIDYTGADPRAISGSNQTWDFSNLDLTSATITNYTYHTDVSASPHASSFTGASFYTSADDGGESYYTNNNDHYSVVGDYFGAPENYLETYSDPQTIYTVPFNYNDTQTDAFESSHHNGADIGKISGTLTTTFDGYGTLILPQGSVSNVARFKVITSQVDTFSYNTDVASYHIKDTAYYWIRPGDLDPVLAIDYTYLHNDDGTDDEAGIQLFVMTSAFTTGLTGSVSYLQANLFPQPASSAVTVTAKSLEGNCHINISNLNGISIASEEQEASNETLTLNVQSLKSGLYVMEIQNEDRLYRQKLVIK
ncbi:MAG: hypothetical protein JWO58_2996 [Chitinophagaceae bacterium]|nr:hypothetical protein [Chitinophagaceae bacterium]